ncbi:MAG: cyclase family protein [Leptolyngbyaceae cyanobacterium SU_3_3]|nr:cyclase family protein [Leptolyngbyaceae cyanobacterium SU_3_3]
MTYIDVSVDVSDDLPVWPGSPAIRFERNLALDAGDIANDTTLNFSVHTGTHIDAPLHFLPNGKSVDQISLDILIGPVYVAEVPDDIDVITVSVLENLALTDGIRRLLLKTRNSNLWVSKIHQFEPNFVALTAEAAKWVVEQGIFVIGIDYLSIQRFYDGPETHQILLGAGVLVIEGLNLSQVKPGHYELFCLPLRLKGIEGAPARVVLKSAEYLSK